MLPSDLPHHVPQIVAAWCARLRADADCRPREDERGHAEQALVAALVRVGLAPESDDAALHTLIVAAANYGRMQHSRRLDPDEIGREFSLLRAELWALLSNGPPPPDWEQARRFILRVDAAIGMATRSVLHGGATAAPRS